MLQKRFTRFVPLLQSCAPCKFVVVVPLREGLAGEIIPACDAGLVESRVVDSSAGGVDPAGCDAGEDGFDGGEEGDDEVDGDYGVEAGGLGCGSGEAV